jgi:hypothetical protein
MITCFSSLLLTLTIFFVAPKERTYVGSTPAHGMVRDFLGISFTDSIDFIRWKLELKPGSFDLQCQYGLAQAGTPGFVQEKKVAFAGQLSKKENQYYLQNKSKKLSLHEVNEDVLHFLDAHNQMLIGNGSYSYALNNQSPTKTDQFHIKPLPSTAKGPLVYEGRTPCQELAQLLGLNKSQACNKMKWYLIFFTDAVTQKPTYYLKGGIGYRPETMERGKWQIITGKQGRIIYQLTPDNGAYSLCLLKGDDNILFFIDNQGRLLVGNEDFSYTLNRRKQAYPPVYR